MIPALRTMRPSASRAEHRPSSPARSAVELRARVAQARSTSTTACRTEVRAACPRPSASRSTPRVVTFSPIAAGADREAGGRELVVQLAVDQVHLAQVRLRGSRATRDRCRTVTPWWTSPATPSPATSSMAVHGRLGERVGRAPVHGGDVGDHRSSVAPRPARARAGEFRPAVESAPCPSSRSNTRGHTSRWSR